MKILKIFGLILVGFLILILGLLTYLNFYLSRHSAQAFDYFPKLISQALRAPTPPSRLNFLILGLDYRHDDLEDTQVTDTIIFSQLNFNSSTLSLVSLPRDLWYYPQNFKINQIYPSFINHPSATTDIKSAFTTVTGQTIDHLAIINTSTLTQLIDIVGGVDVYLDYSYQDDQFPNPEYIANPSADVPIYISINFPQGLNHIDSSNINYFVRSRKGADTPQLGGTDLGRIQRQQLLISALFDKIKQPQSLSSDQIFDLYQLFHQHITTDLTDLDLLQLIFHYRHRLFDLKINKINIPIGDNPKQAPLYDPGKLVFGQWIFLPSSTDYASLHQFISQSLP